LYDSWAQNAVKRFWNRSLSDAQPGCVVVIKVTVFDATNFVILNDIQDSIILFFAVDVY
jgi:hypothetical protein